MKPKPLGFETAIMMLLFALAFGLRYAPRLFLRRSKMLLRDTLVKAHPTFAWLRWTWLLDILLIALMLAICVGFMAFLEGRPASLYLLVIIISGPEAIHGLFAALSGVYVLDYRFRGYLYVYEGGARSAGRLQFCLAIILTGMAFLLAIATPGE